MALVKKKDNPLRIFIFDATRLRSHLFFRYLSTSLDVAPISHPFLPAAMFGAQPIAGRLKLADKRRHEVEVELKPLQVPDTYESSAQNLSKAVAEAEAQGLIPLANEHWWTVLKPEMVVDLVQGRIQTTAELGHNPTAIPDDIFDTLTPIILIRHPALSINSIYRDALKMTKHRPGDEDWHMITSNKFNRLLFDFFNEQGRQPIVVDGEDLLWRTEEMTKNMCSAIGIDSMKFSDTWKPTSQAEIDRINHWVYTLTKNIHDSSGIERPAERPPAPDIDATFNDWKEKYGGIIAEQLMNQVKENMPHYEYMKQLKV